MIKTVEMKELKKEVRELLKSNGFKATYSIGGYTLFVTCANEEVANVSCFLRTQRNNTYNNFVWVLSK